MRPDPSTSERARLLERRKVIAGAGVAAAAWAAPSVVRFDIAAAQGSAMPVIIEPGNVPMSVTVAPNVQSTIAGEPVFGLFGRGDGDNGPLFTVSDPAPPAHSQVTVLVRICYKDSWEGPGSSSQFQDSLDIQVNGVSAPGFPLITAIANTCVDYSFTVAHSGPLTLTTSCDVTAIPEDYGVARVELLYS